ncbi:hypothetical protein F3168_10195 [Polymorphobacter fuscus]|uniref:DUF2306 domain-containing protein n=2 Tax=Sandarakinorhabdus fusca TaxID=1439888 RepID=A0A7C9GS54_9SPHN|nr:hypothetical protein F9290_10195 [Polymorphobacter fuscus]MQT17631.1 hypothetical protein [Polymorphobacter fuscus]
MAGVPRATAGNDDRFFVISAFAMAAVVVAGFSLQAAMGRSSFNAPPLLHAHAIVFMGWVGIYVSQTVLASRGNRALHRRLGWVAAGWIVAMLVLGCLVTLAMVRRGQVPFFFVPLQFLVFDPLTLFTFAGLSAAAIVKRRQTQWHRRLHFCGMSMLLGPAFGRLLPVPLLAPFAFEATFVATLLFPVAGIIADLRRTGRVHPAWGWGVGTMVATLLAVEALTYGPLGPPLYASLTAGTPGAAVPALEFPPPPMGPQVTGRP